MLFSSNPTELQFPSFITLDNIHFGSYFQGKLAEVNDPSVYINPDQPLISKTTVSQDDVEKQEAKVNSTRARLAKALEALSG